MREIPGSLEIMGFGVEARVPCELPVVNGGRRHHHWRPRNAIQCFIRVLLTVSAFWEGSSKIEGNSWNTYRV